MARSYTFLLVALIALLFALGQVHCRKGRSVSGSESDSQPQKKGLEVLKEWNVIDYKWDSDAEREAAIQNGTYIPLNVILWDIEVFYFCPSAKDSCAKAETMIFVTTPRIRLTGTPAVLSTIDAKDGKRNPPLRPYPNWEFNRQGNCNGFADVYGTDTDTCNRLWVLDAGDTGLIDLQQEQDICPPKIYIFEDPTKGGNLVAVTPIPRRVLRCNSVLIAIATDSVTVGGSCNNTFAYISDTKGNALVVFSLADESWSRVDHNSLYPDRYRGDFFVDGIRFQEMGGVLCQSLGPINHNNDRTVYYHTYSGVKKSYVQASILRNQTAFQADERSYPDLFYYFEKEMESQSTIDCMNNQGIMFFTLLSQNALACWNSKRDPHYTKTPIIAQNNKTMQFLTRMKVYNNQYFTTSSRQQDYFYGNVSTNVTNYRLLFGCVPELIQGTACENL